MIQNNNISALSGRKSGFAYGLFDGALSGNRKSSAAKDSKHRVEAHRAMREIDYHHNRNEHAARLLEAPEYIRAVGAANLDVTKAADKHGLKHEVKSTKTMHKVNSRIAEDRHSQTMAFGDQLNAQKIGHFQDQVAAGMRRPVSGSGSPGKAPKSSPAPAAQPWNRPAGASPSAVRSAASGNPAPAPQRQRPNVPVPPGAAPDEGLTKKQAGNFGAVSDDLGAIARRMNAGRQVNSPDPATSSPDAAPKSGQNRKPTDRPKATGRVAIHGSYASSDAGDAPSAASSNLPKRGPISLKKRPAGQGAPSVNSANSRSMQFGQPSKATPAPAPVVPVSRPTAPAPADPSEVKRKNRGGEKFSPAGTETTAVKSPGVFSAGDDASPRVDVRAQTTIKRASSQAMGEISSQASDQINSTRTWLDIKTGERTDPPKHAQTAGPQNVVRVSDHEAPKAPESKPSIGQRIVGAVQRDIGDMAANRVNKANRKRTTAQVRAEPVTNNRHPLVNASFVPSRPPADRLRHTGHVNIPMDSTHAHGNSLVPGVTLRGGNKPGWERRSDALVDEVQKSRR